jgi:MarR family transcriptional regulator, organic hydroperoxide resistance regulator
VTSGRNTEIPIEDYLCLALYRASRSIKNLYRTLLDDLDLTYPQYLVMRILWQRGPMPVKDIAAALQLDYGTLSPLLKRLEARELVLRTRRSDDERSVEIALTPNGEAMRAEAQDVPTEFSCAMDLDGRTERELLETLRQLTASVNGIASSRS